ncbi:MAG TPA: hypothetical protein PKM25_02620, partial [Candidatus Ozemobacteraceae bacterium]|nr:hypothetical protein [Candidatus Ozemobacteraceae bacterium]
STLDNGNLQIAGSVVLTDGSVSKTMAYTTIKDKATGNFLVTITSVPVQIGFTYVPSANIPVQNGTYTDGTINGTFVIQKGGYCMMTLNGSQQTPFFVNW